MGMQANTQIIYFTYKMFSLPYYSFSISPLLNDLVLPSLNFSEVLNIYFFKLKNKIMNLFTYFESI